MTMLLVARDAVLEQPSGLRRVSLHDCLQGRWGLLFSDPQDFAPHPSTPPGFLTYLADEFQRARTRPFAVIHRLEQSLAPHWLQHATDDRSLLVLDCAVSRVVDFASRALVRKLRGLSSPYVLVLDEYGRCRSTICYRARRIDRPRTVEELLCMITALRGESIDAGRSLATAADVLTP